MEIVDIDQTAESIGAVLKKVAQKNKFKDFIAVGAGIPVGYASEVENALLDLVALKKMVEKLH